MSEEGRKSFRDVRSYRRRKTVAELMLDRNDKHYDALETRSADERAAQQLVQLNAQLASKRDGGGGVAGRPCGPARAAEIRPRGATGRGAAFRRSAGCATSPMCSRAPGPIYEPGGVSHDWWRVGRFLHAAGIGAGDIVQNCFGYHLTPAGMIFENGARAVGAAVLPAGVGQTELQVRAAKDVGATAYAGTPDYLKVILDAADAAGVTLKITRAAVGGGALFPKFAGRIRRSRHRLPAILCHSRIWATSAYESEAMEGMIVDGGRDRPRIVRPGTGDPGCPRGGEVGEVVVTDAQPRLSVDPVFATGPTCRRSFRGRALAGERTCGSKAGWPRADQTTKIKGHVSLRRPQQGWGRVRGAP